MSDVVQKLWGFCHTLRHDGIDYGDYIEQITFLLFLKMADEKAIELPKGCDWPTLRDESGSRLDRPLRRPAPQAGQARAGILGDIYAEAQSRFNNPVNLKKLINLIDETEWTALGVDVKAEAYEGLLEKAASEGKKGAGQYFTPRVLIQSIVRCMKPDPRVHKEFTISDPACGTGGFLVAAYEWLIARNPGRGAGPRNGPAGPQEDLSRPGPGGPAPPDGPDEPLPARPGTARSCWATRSTKSRPAERFDCILTNPPFGTKGANQAPEREDFTDRHQQQAAQLRAAHPDDPQAGRPGRRRAARQLPLRRSGRRGLQDPGRGLQPAHRLAAAPRHVHALQPGREGQRGLLQPRATRPNRSGSTTPAPTCRASPRKTAP